MNLTRIADASSEAINLSDVKEQLRIFGNDDDVSLRFFIAAIRHKTETFLGKTLITSTWSYSLDAFEDVIQLPMDPIQSISSISYVDTDGNNQTFTNFQFDRSGRLKPAFGYSWPSTRSEFDAVTINYVSGEDLVKQDIVLAMLLWIGACDISRENNQIGVSISTIPDGARNILAPYRNVKL